MREFTSPKLELRNLNGLPTLTDEGLFESIGVRIAFTGREGGVSEGVYATLNTADHVADDPAAVEVNRTRVLSALGVPDAPLVVPNQVHGTSVVLVDDLEHFDEACNAVKAGCDAVVVTTRGVAVLFNFADCLSLIVVAKNGAFAIVHAGWRGAIAHVAAKGVEELARASGCPPSQFDAYIGPHICRECFEVGEEVADAFRFEFGDAAVPNTRHVDLSEAVSIDLERSGLLRARIANCGVCTTCNPDLYFSYRASGGTCGRHAAVAIAS